MLGDHYFQSGGEEWGRPAFRDYGWREDAYTQDISFQSRRYHGELSFRAVKKRGGELLSGREFRTLAGLMATLELRYPGLMRSQTSLIVK